MVADDVVVGHPWCDGAVGKHHLVGGVVQNLGRVGHEDELSRGRCHCKHGEQGLLIALAAGGDVLLVKQSQGHTARGTGQRNQVKAVQGKGIQAVAVHDVA